ncbi:hypothetical protein GCM10027269_36690 [Kribbella endophytica]
MGAPESAGGVRGVAPAPAAELLGLAGGVAGVPLVLAIELAAGLVGGLLDAALVELDAADCPPAAAEVELPADEVSLAEGAGCSAGFAACGRRGVCAGIGV